MAKSPRAERTENGLGTVVLTSRRTRGAAERRMARQQTPCRTTECGTPVSGRTWYGDDSPHPDPLEPAGRQARLVKTVNLQGGSAKAPLEETVGWVPSQAGNDYNTYFDAGTGPGCLIAIDWVTGRSHAGRHREKRGCLVPAELSLRAEIGVAQCTVRPW